MLWMDQPSLAARADLSQVVRRQDKRSVWLGSIPAANCAAVLCQCCETRLRATLPTVCTRGAVAVTHPISLPMARPPVDVDVDELSGFIQLRNIVSVNLRIEIC